MYRTIGHVTRIAGLLIEMIGVWAVYTGRDDKHQTLISLPDGSALSAAWVAVGLGFVLWVIGTIVVYTSRSRRNVREKDAPDRDAERFG